MKNVKIKADLKGRAMAWLFLVCSLLGCLLALSTRPGLYRTYWNNSTDVPWRYIFRVDPQSHQALFEAIPRALNGDLDALRLQVPDLEGRRMRAFNEREIAHMADVAHLFRLAKIVLAASALALLGLAVMSRHRARQGAGWQGIAKGALIGVLDGALIAVAIAIWTALDFRSVFWLFHQIAFTNDLWLLDPDTDLLIRMLPQNFFETVTFVIAVCWAFCVMCWCACWGIARGRQKAGHGEEG